MKLTGKNIIENDFFAENTASFFAYDPQKREYLDPPYFDASENEINLAVEKANAAFKIYSQVSHIQRSEFLNCIAEEVEKLGSLLIERAMAETALPESRLLAERNRTVKQLRLFANLISDASWVDARIDTPDETDFEVVSEIDIRQMLIPLGPVAVFTASNFPLAFSVCGGDVASALAAGCPVIVKAHPYQPGTSELLARALLNAINMCGLPAGIFALLHGSSHDVGKALLTHPLIKAGAFTGSFYAGKTLFDTVNSRLEPIPFFAEMGSINPVFFLPSVINESPDRLAKQYVNSLNLGGGQFCTNPGISFIFNGSGTETFFNCIKKYVSQENATTLLSLNIQNQLKLKLEKLKLLKDVNLLAQGVFNDNQIPVEIYSISADDFIKNSFFREEFFGPVGFMIVVENEVEFFDAIGVLGGQLTASIHFSEADKPLVKKIMDIVKFKVGRVVANGFPTGVEVCHAMHHGGPFPATTNIYSTSVGSAAIKRFVRPVCYQNFPDDLLSEELNNNNSINIWRLINGYLSQKSI